MIRRVFLLTIVAALTGCVLASAAPMLEEIRDDSGESAAPRVSAASMILAELDLVLVSDGEDSEVAVGGQAAGSLFCEKHPGFDFDEGSIVWSLFENPDSPAVDDTDLMFEKARNDTAE